MYFKSCTRKHQKKKQKNKVYIFYLVEKICCSSTFSIFTRCTVVELEAILLLCSTTISVLVETPQASWSAKVGDRLWWLWWWWWWSEELRSVVVVVEERSWSRCDVDWSSWSWSWSCEPLIWFWCFLFFFTPACHFLMAFTVCSSRTDLLKFEPICVTRAYRGRVI